MPSVPATRSSGDDPAGVYVELTRQALLALSGQPFTDPALQPYPLSPNAALMPLWQQNGPLATPQAAWHKDGRYVTLLRLANSGASALAVDARQLRGRWLAATFESNELAPGAGMALILISDLPYEQALLQMPISNSKAKP